MKALIAKLRSIPKIVIVAVVLIIVGLAIMIPKGQQMVANFKEAQYAIQHDFAKGNASPEDIRPWMTIRYIAVAFSVPQSYLLESVGQPATMKNSMISVKRLNDELRMGNAGNKEPVLLGKMREAILAYRANPVVTGLDENRVMGWMTVKYISNSTGIPVEKLFEGIGIQSTEKEYLILDFLTKEIKYPGGPKALNTALQKVVDANQVKP